EVMWNEAAGVACDTRIVFAQADARRLAVDHPRADENVVVTETRQRRQRLVDRSLGAIVAAGRLDDVAVAPRHVCAFAGEFRLAYVARAESISLEVSGQQIGML